MLHEDRAVVRGRDKAPAQVADLDGRAIRAKVSLDLRVLTYQDLGLFSAGGALYMAHQVAKEVLATLDSVSTARAIPGVNRIIGSVGRISTLPSTFGL